VACQVTLSLVARPCSSSSIRVHRLTVYQPPWRSTSFEKAGLSEFKVFAIEGEGALTAGGSHEAKNGAWGYGLGNLYWLVDWNDLALMIEEHLQWSLVA